MKKSHIDEFRGFFFADGSATIVKMNKKYKDRRIPLYCARLQITQRDDNKVILDKIQDWFGGYVLKMNVANRNSNPALYWVLQDAKGVRNVSKELLKTKMPYRNLDAVRAVYEYCDWRLKRGLQKGYEKKDFEKIEKWRERVKEAHLYKSSK